MQDQLGVGPWRVGDDAIADAVRIGEIEQRFCPLCRHDVADPVAIKLLLSRHGRHAVAGRQLRQKACRDRVARKTHDAAHIGGTIQMHTVFGEHV